MGELIGGRELSRRLGISETMVRKHRLNGLFVYAAPNKFDWEKSEAAYRMNRDPDGVRRAQLSAVGAGDDGVTSGAESSLTKARAAQALLRGERDRLALEKARGEVIRKSDALAAARLVIVTVTERMDGVASQLAPRLVGMQNAAEIERMIRAAINGVRGEVEALATTLEGTGHGRSER